MLGSMPVLVADPVVVSAAPAQDAPKLEASSEPKASWYGWQPLLTDTGSAMLFVFALKVNNGRGGAVADVLAATSLFGYAFAGPIVHWQHDRSLMSYIDFSMRLGLPLLLGQLAATSSSQSDIGGSCTAFCGDEGTNFAEGLVAGMATAVLVDAIAFSWESVAAAKPSAARTPRLQWTPIAGAARGGAMGGLGGTF